MTPDRDRISTIMDFSVLLARAALRGLATSVAASALVLLAA